VAVLAAGQRPRQTRKWQPPITNKMPTFPNFPTFQFRIWGRLVVVWGRTDETSGFA
jgi:hypothetical protein